MQFPHFHVPQTISEQVSNPVLLLKGKQCWATCPANEAKDVRGLASLKWSEIKSKANITSSFAPVLLKFPWSAGKYLLGFVPEEAGRSPRQPPCSQALHWKPSPFHGRFARCSSICGFLGQQANLETGKQTWTAERKNVAASNRMNWWYSLYSISFFLYVSICLQMKVCT